MKLFSGIFLFSYFSFNVILSNAYAIDVGDGSDGSCDVLGTATTTITGTKKSYQCTTLTINDNLNVFRGDQAGAGGSGVVIKVMGAVTIQAGKTFDLSGANGNDGASAGTIAGGAGGAGGNAGGAGNFSDGSNGLGSGAGIKGLFVSNGSVAQTSYGGGGGGASYETIGSNPLNGSDGGGSASLNTKGTNGSTYGNANNFETSFLGGSGGAAGGGGVDSAQVAYKGSSGGGGGGSLMIVAGGTITVSGTIKANGGNGGGISSPVSSGGGGGGSGGAIWLMSAQNITVTGLIQVNGGTGGDNDSFGTYGVGGNGGAGRVRLDDQDGTVANAANFPASTVMKVFTPTTQSASTLTVTEYRSAVHCAKVMEEDKNLKNILMHFIFSMLIGFSSIFLLRKIIRKINS